MRKQIQLNIPTPCHESWDKMTPAEKGKFCSSCKKEVIDFTKMSDTHLVAFFRKQTTGSVCGRFMQDQLDRSMEIPKKRIPWIKYFFQIALPAFIMTSKGYAQGNVKTIKGKTIPAIALKDDCRKPLSKISMLENGKLIRGRVFDEVNESVPYATVLIKGTPSVTVADSSGFFELIYRGTQDEIVLAASCLGFEEKELTVDIQDSERLLIVVMKKYIKILDELVVEASLEGTVGMVIVGGLSVTSTVVEEKNIMDTLAKILFPANIIESVYPNPAKSNAAINIKLENRKEGTYSIQLFNLSGQLLLNKELWIGEGTNSIGIQMPVVANGTYLIRLVNRKSGKFTTTKIIIE